MNQKQCLFKRQNSMILECYNDSDCTGDSDTCVSNTCFCGITAKCSGRLSVCSGGQCRGMWFLTLKNLSVSSKINSYYISSKNLLKFHLLF